MRLLGLLCVLGAACSPTQRVVVPTTAVPEFVRFTDDRVEDGAPFGRFEELYEGSVAAFTTSRLSDWLSRVDSERWQLHVRLLDLRWRWSASPFFLASISTVVRVLIEVRARGGDALVSTFVASAVNSDRVPNSSSLEQLRMLFERGLSEVSASLDAAPDLRAVRRHSSP